MIWVIAILILLVILVVVFRGFGEDSWIKNEKGIYIKHGNPLKTPVYVKEQQDAVICAVDLYENALTNSMDFDSQCLGTCKDYAVDIVNVPRSDIDNKVENQCEDYRNGIVNHFIELDKKGIVVRIE